MSRDILTNWYAAALQSREQLEYSVEVYESLTEKYRRKLIKLNEAIAEYERERAEATKC